MATKHMNYPEVAVLERLLPEGLTADMHDVAVCLFEALVLGDERAGKLPAPPGWMEQLSAWAQQVLVQLQHLAAKKGGRTFYLPRGVMVHLTARDRELCGKFRGNNYYELAREYDLTEMRVRQIVDQWQRIKFRTRQGVLPGVEEA